jgi:two-component system, OmpR family, sensor kinase
MSLAILGAFGVAVLVVHTLAPHPRFDAHRIEAFAATEFARVWNEPTRRHELVTSLSETFELELTLRDRQGAVVDQVGDTCSSPNYTLVVRAEPRAGALGSLDVCSAASFGFKTPWFLGFATFAGTLWLMSGFLAHRLGRPLGHLVEVTRAIGAGDLKSRARLGRHQPGEIGILAESINFMAGRIEKQIQDQKELLAAVSHEVRTPLARLRVVEELLEGRGADPKLTAELGREVREIDDLVGQLLAHSRLEFHASQVKNLSALDLAKTALERQGLSLGLLDCPEDLELTGDATLLGRAFTNLLQNAEVHGRGTSKFLITALAGTLRFQVEDRGPGIPDNELERIFDPFVGRGAGGSSLGLGLSLVRRIARAHGGDAWAENHAAGGARVGFWIPKAGSASEREPVRPPPEL